MYIIRRAPGRLSRDRRLRRRRHRLHGVLRGDYYVAVYDRYIPMAAFCDCHIAIHDVYTYIHIYTYRRLVISLKLLKVI